MGVVQNKIDIKELTDGKISNQDFMFKQWNLLSDGTSATVQQDINVDGYTPLAISGYQAVGGQAGGINLHSLYFNPKSGNAFAQWNTTLSSGVGVSIYVVYVKKVA